MYSNRIQQQSYDLSLFLSLLKHIIFWRINAREKEYESSYYMMCAFLTIVCDAWPTVYTNSSTLILYQSWVYGHIFSFFFLSILIPIFLVFFFLSPALSTLCGAHPLCHRIHFGFVLVLVFILILCTRFHSTYFLFSFRYITLPFDSRSIAQRFVFVLMHL